MISFIKRLPHYKLIYDECWTCLSTTKKLKIQFKKYKINFTCEMYEWLRYHNTFNNLKLRKFIIIKK